MRYRLVAKLSSATGAMPRKGASRGYSSEVLLASPLLRDASDEARIIIIRASRPRDGLSDASLASWNVYSPKFI